MKKKAVNDSFIFLRDPANVGEGEITLYIACVCVCVCVSKLHSESLFLTFDYDINHRALIILNITDLFYYWK